METAEKAPPNTALPTYVIRRAATTPELLGKWDGPAWRDVEPLSIDHFHPRGSDHRPITYAKAVYDDRGIYVIFDVVDRYVRCVHTEFQGAVWKDSCVEFFVQPGEGTGYLNFEFNCGGWLLVSHVIDASRSETGLKNAVPLTKEQIAGLRIYHSMPERIEPELAVQTSWQLEAFVAWTVFDQFREKKGVPIGEIWRGNFYKCGDETSHPHWGAWSDIASELNFHQPAYFGRLILA